MARKGPACSLQVNEVLRSCATGSPTFTRRGTPGRAFLRQRVGLRRSRPCRAAWSAPHIRVPSPAEPLRPGRCAAWPLWSGPPGVPPRPARPRTRWLSANRSSSPARRSHRPSASACSPRTRRPLSKRSAAAWRPTTAGSVTVSAKPWWKPRREKLALNRLCAVATRKSAERASPQPPPMAAPCTAATTGSGAANRHSAALYSAAMSWPALTEKSSPAQKCLPSEPSTIDRHHPERSSAS